MSPTMSRKRALSPKMFAQDRLEVGVDLHRDNASAGVEQASGECSGAGPDLEHEVAVGDGRGVKDAGHVVAVVQEVLPEAVLGVQAVGGKEVLDVGEGLGQESDPQMDRMGRIRRKQGGGSIG